jgi:putative ABC transport system permease protein
VINEIANAILGDEGTGVSIRLHVEPASLLAGALTGLAICLITVWATSARLSRLNVIAAIRDLAQPRRARQSALGAMLGAAGAVLGALLFFAGESSENPAMVMLGVPLALFSLIPVLMRFAPRKPVVIVLCLGVVAWVISVFTLFPDAMASPDIPVFVLMGVLLVGAAVAIASQVDRLWVRLNQHLSGVGGGLSARLGLAYPLARKFRTGMLLGMYAIVIFTMTFMSTFIGIFGAQAPAFTADIAAGYDLFVESSPGNPATSEQLLEQPGVEAVAPLLYGVPDWEGGGEEGAFPLTGYDESLLAFGGIGLADRDAAFASDAELWEAMLTDESLVVVDDYFLQDGGGPPEGLAGVGDVVTVRNPATLEERELTVAGVLDADFVFHGVLAGRPFVEDFLGPQSAQFRHYVQASEGQDPDELAERLTGVMVANGVDAESFRARVDERLAVQQNFFAMMRGFLGLGLIIGIAGLGVVMVRAVRERRREIGMLRAMGFSSGVVRRAFLVEAAFIAVQGSLIGIALGLVTTYEVAVNSSTFGELALDFQVPWSTIGLIFVVPLLASLLAAAVPATQAARIKPAVALRIAD